MLFLIYLQFIVGFTFAALTPYLFGLKLTDTSQLIGRNLTDYVLILHISISRMIHFHHATVRQPCIAQQLRPSVFCLSFTYRYRDEI